VPHHFFRHVTDEQPLNTRPSMGGQHDQIDPLISAASRICSNALPLAIRYLTLGSISTQG
jgi:hypothetical protein